ncbi:MAG: hypothetical protein M3O41_15575 [Pseudomonadota bacterium]|nr:hypothetical protein [Pseudomonadota bacterium]
MQQVTVLTRLPRHFELRVAFITAIALLIAQLGAMAHAYSHDSMLGSMSTHQSAPSSHDTCNDCLAFAPLLSAAGGPTTLHCIHRPCRSLAARAGNRSLVDRSLTLAFRSRAPPDTL